MSQADVTYYKDGVLAATEVELCGKKYNRFEASLYPDAHNLDDEVEAHYIDMTNIISLSMDPNLLNPDEFQGKKNSSHSSTVWVGSRPFFSFQVYTNDYKEVYIFKN